MYKYIIALVMLFAVCAIWAQSPESLRHYTLGTVMDGEWEDIYDPIGLSFYNQTYYYTSLSDYLQHMNVYGGEVQFVEESRFLSEYPFGCSFTNPFDKAIRHALLIRFKDSMVPNLSNGYGESESVTTEYYDLNGDYIYDLKQYSILKQTDYTDMADKLYMLLNTSVPMGEGVFGVKLSYDFDCQEWDEAVMQVDPTGFSTYLDGFSEGDIGEERYFSSTNLDTGITNVEYSEKGKFETTASTGTMDCLISYMQPTSLIAGNNELRYNLNLTFDSKNLNETNDRYSGEYYRVFNEDTHGEGVFDQTYDRLWRMPRAEVFGSVKLRRNLDEGKPRYKQSFVEIGLGLGGFGGAYEDSFTEQLNSNSLYVDTTSVDTQEIENTDIMETSDNSGNYFGFHGNLTARSGIFFSEYVCFGYGVNLDIQTFRRKSDNDYEYNYVNINQLGTAFDDIDDVKITTRNSYTYNQELAQTNLVTTLPVGLEFSLPKTSLTDHDSFSLRNFTFRVGTVFTHNIEYRDYRNKLDDVEVNNTVTEYGDGTVFETHSDDYVFTNSHDQSTQANGFKRFTAGLGYEHSDFLNIDLGGHVDSDGENYFIGAMFTVKR
jgi:hypothetical protein